MAYLEVRGLRKSYVTPRGTTDVLGGVDLALDEGEFVAIVGYSGSGKTTLVSLVAGLLPPDAGTIVLDGQAVGEPGPERGVVFQQYSLLQWMTVYENVALAVDAVNPDLDAPARRALMCMAPPLGEYFTAFESRFSRISRILPRSATSVTSSIFTSRRTRCDSSVSC